VTIDLTVEVAPLVAKFAIRETTLMATKVPHHSARKERGSGGTTKVALR